MKKLIGAVLVAALIFLFVTCGSSVFADGSTDSAAPTSSASRTSRSETVSVTETYAKADVVGSPAPTAQVNTNGSDTPATGDFPVVYVAGAVGLILFCSAGLLMLKKI